MPRNNVSLVLHLVHHVVEGVTRPSFGAASAFSGVACMALKVFPMSVFVINVELLHSRAKISKRLPPSPPFRVGEPRSDPVSIP